MTSKNGNSSIRLMGKLEWFSENKLGITSLLGCLLTESKTSLPPTPSHEPAERLVSHSALLCTHALCRRGFNSISVPPPPPKKINNGSSAYFCPSFREEFRGSSCQPELNSPRHGVVYSGRVVRPLMDAASALNGPIGVVQARGLTTVPSSLR